MTSTSSHALPVRQVPQERQAHQVMEPRFPLFSEQLEPLEQQKLGLEIQLKRQEPERLLESPMRQELVQLERQEPAARPAQQPVTTPLVQQSGMKAA